ncbi:Major Facilitator Superfamily protein [Friedmanniella luteola]|uniref:Major Facilitator Superfamily protein n=1 Tax=Friedmanniella luteola TaxID=546871 RepID=A0A1H1TU47_9ACTN|nr:MFS transporter [Friedmanniella luteola]SDS63722.1 Major Facilitator Superfamily protein [Friedmanniella luteola]
MTALSAAAARRRLLLLTATRWLPVGLVFGLTTLLPLERGLSLAQVSLVLAVQGFVVLALELPTGGLADAVGRRPLLVAAALVAVVSGVLFLLATDVATFAVAMLLQGVFRALDSGPLEAWYVDAAQADDPQVAVERTLGHAGAVLGMAIAGGALVSGGLVAWHPVTGSSALVLPYLVATALLGLHALLVLLLVAEPGPGAPAARSEARRRAWDAARGTPRVVRDGLVVVTRNPVLRGLVLVEVFWSVAMIAFETLNPVRLAELVGGEQRAGALYGPASAAAWALFAAGSAAAGLAATRLGVARTAVLVRVLNGGFVVVMGLVAGPVGLVAAYWLAYLTHGAANPVHSTLLHRQAERAHRVTVLSVSSMVSGGVYSLGLLALGPLAQSTSTATAMVVAGAVSVVGALGYAPALRDERAGRATSPVPEASPARR